MISSPPRASLARRFVDEQIARIIEASQPFARAQLLFTLVTASLVVHLLVVYSEYVFAARTTSRSKS